MRKENLSIEWYEQAELIPKSSHAWTTDGIFGRLISKEELIDKCLFYFSIYGFITINGKYFRTRDDIPRFGNELTDNYYIMTEHENRDEYDEIVDLYAEIHTTNEIGIPEGKLKNLFISLAR